MNRKFIDFIKLPESVRIPWVWGKWHNITNRWANEAIMKETIPESPLNSNPREETVTVSLTSFPARIHIAHIAIKSLFLQSYRPDRIVLWLAKSQFPDEVIPAELEELKKYGLEIYFCEHDILGHKKYFWSLIEQKENEIVVTYDDDIVYPPNSLEMLINTHKKFPRSIVCNRAQEFMADADGNVINPGGWKIISNEGVKKPSFKLNPSNGGGCLYPYDAVHEDARNIDVIVENALRGDDIWTMFMAAAKGTPIVKTRKYHRTFTVVADSQEQQLATGNVVGNNYMVMLDKLKNRYPEAWNRISAKEK